MAITLAVDEIESVSPVVKLKVIGVGGGGCNAVKRMHETILADEDNERKTKEQIHEYHQGVSRGDVELIVANTDLQVLKPNPVIHKLQLGTRLTKGMGAGSDPEVGRKAAEEDKEQIKAALAGTDLLFIAAGMGGGTGTGSTPVIADIAKQMGILTLAVVTRPFSFEGSNRMELAERGIQELKSYVDSLVVIPNDKITFLFGEEKVPMLKAFGYVDDVLRKGVLNIAKTIYETGYINADLNDFRTAMSKKGTAVLGFAEASGENRAVEAIETAINSPLLENINIQTAKSMIVSVICDLNTFGFDEYEKIGVFIKEKTNNPNVHIKIAVIGDTNLGQNLQVTLLATGIEDNDSFSSSTEDDIFSTPSGFTSGASFQAAEPTGFVDGSNNFSSFSAQRTDDFVDIRTNTYNDSSKTKGGGVLGLFRKAKK